MKTILGLNGYTISVADLFLIMLCCSCVRVPLCWFQECARYSVNLVEARDFGIKKGFVNGGSMGLIFFIMFGSYALAFWYGTQLFLEENYSPGDILVVSVTSNCLN